MIVKLEAQARNEAIALIALRGEDGAEALARRHLRGATDEGARARWDRVIAHIQKIRRVEEG